FPALFARPWAPVVVAVLGTVAAGPTSPAVRWPAPRCSRSQLLCRDRVHGPHFDPVAAAARPGAWLWVAGDLLAPAHRVGQGGRVRSAAPRNPGPAWPAGRA